MSSTRITIISVGSHGDVAPYAGLGVRLREAGYAVTIAGDKALSGLATDVGLDFRPLSVELRANAGNEISREYARKGLFSRGGVQMLKAARNFLRAMNQEAAAITADSAVDMVLLNPLSMAGYHVARARGMPSAGVLLAPYAPTHEFPPPVAFPRSFGSLGNRAAWRAMRLTEGSYFRSVNEVRGEHGLPPTTLAQTYREQERERWPLLHGVSRHVVARPSDWRPGADLVGYWWPVVPAGWTPPQELCDFLAAGPPPVFVGFGSSDPGAAERLSRTVIAALRAAGRRGVVQAGWVGIGGAGDDMLSIGEVPHEWLFPRMAAVVHSGSAGVTAAGLRAGAPAVGVPMMGDQPFWARRLVSVGVSPGAVPFRTLTADRLADAVREAVGNPRYARRATELAARIKTEDGAAAVSETVARLTG